MLPIMIGGGVARGCARSSPAAILYFGCLGLGYIAVEVGLISDFTRALSNPTISAAIVISGMLVFSGIGSLLAERVHAAVGMALPLLLAAIAVLLVITSVVLPPLLDWIGAFPYKVRAVLSLFLVAPTAFLMGFPMATVMNWLARNGHDRMFVWAWGINGCSSVIGAAAVPLVAVTFGLSAVLKLSAMAYLIAIPAFLVLRASSE